MRIVTDEYPKSAKDCPFAAQENNRGPYFCKLGNQEKRVCRNPSKCTKLVEMDAHATSK